VVLLVAHQQQRQHLFISHLVNIALTLSKKFSAANQSQTGTYLVSGTIVSLYNTQLVGNPIDKPVIKAAAKFVGTDGTNGVISSDTYIINGFGDEWYTPVVSNGKFVKKSVY